MSPNREVTLCNIIVEYRLGQVLFDLREVGRGVLVLLPEPGQPFVVNILALGREPELLLSVHCVWKPVNRYYVTYGLSNSLAFVVVINNV